MTTKTQTTSVYYTLHGKGVATGHNIFSPEEKEGDEIDICWSMWYGMGGEKQACWQKGNNGISLDWPLAKSHFQSYRSSNHLSGYGFNKGHITEIRKHTVTTIIETETEVIENV